MSQAAEAAAPESEARHVGDDAALFSGPQNEDPKHDANAPETKEAKQEAPSKTPTNHLATPVDNLPDAQSQALADKIGDGSVKVPNHLNSDVQFQETGKGAPEDYSLEGLVFNIPDPDNPDQLKEVPLEDYLRDAHPSEQKLAQLAFEDARQLGLNQEQAEEHFLRLNGYRDAAMRAGMEQFNETVQDMHDRSRQLGYLSRQSVRTIQQGLQAIDDPDGSLGRFLQDTGLFAHPAMNRLLMAAGEMYGEGSGASRNKEVSTANNQGETPQHQGQSGFGVPGSYEAYDPSRTPEANQHNTLSMFGFPKEKANK